MDVQEIRQNRKPEKAALKWRTIKSKGQRSDRHRKLDRILCRKYPGIVISSICLELSYGTDTREGLERFFSDCPELVDCFYYDDGGLRYPLYYEKPLLPD